MLQTVLLLVAIGVAAACGGGESDEITAGAAPADFCDTFWSSIIFEADGEELVFPEPDLMRQAAADLRETGVPADASEAVRSALGRWAETLDAAEDGTDPYKEFYGADDDAFDRLNSYALVTCEAIRPGRYGGGGQHDDEAWRDYGATLGEDGDLVWRTAEWDAGAEEWRDVETGERVEIADEPRF